ncbi:MAG: ABC transporter ATP-binding protein [Solirubrobacterales bacterium]
MSRPTRVAARSEGLLEVEGLGVEVASEESPRLLVESVSLSIARGETLGLVGESGSGKSMTARAIARLLPAGTRGVGSVRFGGREVWSLAGSGLRRYRSQVAMVFQDPRSHLNPVRRVGDFMTEALVGLHGVSRGEALLQASSALEEVGIDDATGRLDQYPHELSGGLLQRVMIATALLAKPLLLLADEPTTALDVTTQAEVMGILDELRREHGLAMLFITHDLELAAAVCDRTAVMYAGQIVETRSSRLLESDPLHPYSAALIEARPDIESTKPRLPAIPGRPVAAYDAVEGCAFSPRCPCVLPRCREVRPSLQALGGGEVRCWRAEELRGQVAAAVRAGSATLG